MTLYAMQEAFAISYLEAIENATIEERAAAFTAFGDKPLPGIISRVEGSNEATITIAGPMSPAGPSPIAHFFGFSGTGYLDIISASKSLGDDPIVDVVRVIMDTPGGTVAGMDQARQALKELVSKKTVIFENHGQMLSAGYYLAMAGKTIKAMSPLVLTGSIGVIRAGFDFTDAMTRNGVKRIKIVSKNAPNKHPDPTTPHGLGIMQDDIDAHERVFIQVVAKSRNTAEQNVIDNFGKGGEFIAQDPDPDKPDALKAGMIDSVVVQADIITDLNDSDGNSAESIILLDKQQQDTSITGGNVVIPETQAAEGGGQREGTIMDLNQLKAEHPALCAQIEALGVDVGIKRERERVDAHLTMGKASGDMKFAVSCITDGSELTPSINAKYYAAGMNKNAIDDRGGESEGDLETAAAAAEADDKALADATAELLGVEANG